MATNIRVVLLAVSILAACGGSSNAPAKSTSSGNLPTQTSAPGATAPQSASAPGSSSNAASNPSAALGPTAATSPTTGAAGSPSAQPQAQPMQQPAAAPPATTANSGLAMDECGLHTKWAGDEYCIKPPPADKGFQIHVGPSSYDNPDAQYVLQPGQEVTENYPVTSGNTSDVYYYYRQYRMRPGTHHMILYAGGGGFGGFGQKRLGGSQNPAKDNPDKGIIAPENQGVGMMLAANTPISVNLHYINYTQAPIIKEVWVNFWYRDPKDVTEPANEVFSMSPMNVAPGQHVLIHGNCPITQAGRALTLYGHRHANNQRFSIWRERGGMKDLVYEDYDWEHPLVLEYSSIVTNTPADPANKAPGGYSGLLDLQAGDALSFECDIVNNTTSTFRGANEALNDEMCIMVGDSAETTVPALCTYTTTQL